jgi:hypothetical protein
MLCKIYQSFSVLLLLDTMSVVCQDGNLKFSSYSLFTRLGVLMFKYNDLEPSLVLVNPPGQFRSAEDILAWLDDVVGGNDEELRLS